LHLGFLHQGIDEIVLVRSCFRCLL
jgi:hypothetical protein